MCHMCVLCPPISSGAFILARPWREEKSVQELFFDESLNRTKPGGGVKGKKYNALQPWFPPAVLPENTTILHHMHGGLAVISVHTGS